MDPLAAAAPAPVQLVMDYRTQKIADLPLFNGDKSDALSADDFVRKTDAAQEAMRWDDVTTAVHFKACLRGNALTWLKSIEFKSANTTSWIALKPVFSKKYVTAVETTYFLSNLATLQQKQGEHTRDFDARICSILIDVKKARPEFVANIPANVADRSDAVLAASYQRCLDHDLMHIAKCIFISGLLPEFRTKVQEKKPTTYEDANDYANELCESLISSKAKINVSPVNAVTQDDVDDQSDLNYAVTKEEMQEILEIRKKRQGYFQSNQNRGNNSNANRAYQPQRSNQNAPKQNYGQQNQQKYCLYCKMDNHIQENCFVRKRKSHALNGKDGQPMRTPGTREFNLWKSELAAKGKKVMIINDNSNDSSAHHTADLN